MSKVLQAVDTIHQVGIYCLALVPPNYLPRSTVGGIHIHDTMKKLQNGTLHPANVLMCPHTCVLNLPQVKYPHVKHLPVFYMCILFWSIACFSVLFWARPGILSPIGCKVVHAPRCMG